MFTTSRYAAKKTRERARQMAAEADEEFISRGKHTIEELAELARKKGEERISIIEEKGGEPYYISVILVDELGRWRWTDRRHINAK